MVPVICRSALLALLLSVVVFGCDHLQDHRHGDEPPTDSEHSSELTLHDGQKWPLDDHTRAKFAEMNQASERADVSSVAGMNALGVEIRKQVDALIVGCRMEGPAHEQLHVFLMEFIPAAEALATESDPVQAAQALEQVQHLLLEEKRYFE